MRMRMRMGMMMVMVGDWLSVAGGSQIASSRSSSAQLQPPHCRLSCRLADEIYLMQHDGVWGEFAMGSGAQWQATTWSTVFRVSKRRSPTKVDA